MNKSEPQKILEADLLESVDPKMDFCPGTILRRMGKEKDQQGMFTRFDDDGGIILLSIIDPVKGEYIAEAGILKAEEGDRFFAYKDSFHHESHERHEALEILHKWPLYVKNEKLHNAMETFVKSSYSPAQILLYQKTDNLSRLFVPLQQRFYIGRCERRIDWKKRRKELFREKLESLTNGDHLTYLAYIPRTQSESSAFYSAGTKPHYETDLCLQSEPFAFAATHGGHIKAFADKDGKHGFLVDAGSEYRGKGKKATFLDADMVVKSLRQMYHDKNFVSVEGRGAFGTEQSY